MMITALDVGILLPTRGALFGEEPQVEAQRVLELGERAEAAGCHSVWVGDSLTAKPRLDALIMLGAIAARTRRVRIGTAVLLGALYPPVLLARAAASLDVLSGGRLVLAMGVGGAFNPAQEREWLAVGVKARERRGRLEELVEVLPRLWSGAPVTYHGRYFDLEEVRLEPRPLQAGGIPIWLACHHHSGNEAQHRRAARLADGIMSLTDSPAEFAGVLERVRSFAAEYGRDPGRIDAAFYLTVNVDTDEARAQEEASEFVERYYGLNYWRGRWGPYGSPSAVADAIQAYATAGARHVIVRFASFDQARQLDRFAEHVLPALSQAFSP